MNIVRMQRGSPRKPAPSESLSTGRISAELDEGLFRLEDGRCARQALSCLVAPAAADVVLVYEGEETFLLSVLARPRLGEARLGVPRASALSICQARVEVNATEHVALRSGRDLELTAAGGTLALNARDLFTTVAGSLVENVRDYVGRFAQHLMETKGLMRAHSAQALMTAEKEYKVDAERISLG